MILHMVPPMSMPRGIETSVEARLPSLSILARSARRTKGRAIKSKKRFPRTTESKQQRAPPFGRGYKQRQTKIEG
jgi:hypothetical protein